MKRTGTTDLPLHGGKAPGWLFSRMSLLAGEVIEAIAVEFGPDEVLKKISDPYWFQAFGCLLGFDWHSSGVTTTVTGAIKEGLKGREKEIGIFVCGGKGRASRRTPDEIQVYSEAVGVDGEELVTASRLSAKVDNTAVQDGFQLYHHAFIFTLSGRWAVVQQGMNEETRTARRYHWLSEGLKNFVVEPHSAVCCDVRVEGLNMVACESEGARRTVTEIAKENPDKVVGMLARMLEKEESPRLVMPRRHEVGTFDIRPENMRKILIAAYERQPSDFQELLQIRGVGPKTLRALALLSEIVYGEAPSYRDPARFSFAHGGKDGTPFPVERRVYDRTIDIMKKAVESARLGNREKLQALRRLSRFYDV